MAMCLMCGHQPCGSPAPTRAENIPLCQLRERLNEVPTDRPVYVLCNVGQTAWNAHRILEQNGIESYDISGGMQSYALLKGAGSV